MLDKWLEEFKLWNSTHNFMASSEDLSEHCADSLSLIPFLEDTSCNLIVDIGSGGGFPVIPLALWAKEQDNNLQFIATDVIEKKMAFLKYCRAKFGLKMEVRKADKGLFITQPCLITSRAFGNVKEILKWSTAHCQDCQGFLLLKGQKAEEELAEAKVKNYQLIPNPRGVIIRFGFGDQK